MQAAGVKHDKAERYLRKRCLRLCGPRRWKCPCSTSSLLRKLRWVRASL